MSDVKRQYPSVTPDTIRQKLHMDERFFDSHTKQSVGYEHTNQTQYVGNSQNWGAEILLETRRMRLRRPPLGDVILNDVLRTYFEIEYDDNLNTYEQQNAIMCTLKKDVIANRDMYIKFQNVKKVMLPRAVASSESRVYPHLAWKTTTPPELYVEKYPGANQYDVYSLIVTDRNGSDVTYWFQNTSSNINGKTGSNETDDDRAQPMARMLLNEVGTSDTELKTLSFMEWMEGLPLLWFTFTNNTSLPSISMVNNVDQNGDPILTAGSDGNGKHWLYPFAYGNDNLPASTDDNVEWQIRVYTNSIFVTGESVTENKEKYINKIQFVSYRNGDANTTENHRDVITITFDTEHVKLKFVDKDSKWKFDNWSFRQPQEGDWDYDGVLYHNPVYGYLNGYLNCETYSDNPGIYPYLNPIFQILINQDIQNKYDWIQNNAVFGIHVDDTSDYSMNGVIKKNGTIFHLGDFDGLPPYYYYKLPRTVHRPHVELYGVREVVHDNVQHAMDQHVAALIVDAGIPQTKLPDIEIEMESAIIYEYNRTYVTDPDKLLSEDNTKSNIGFSSRSIFGDITLEKYQNASPFIYHGNRTFSLSVMGFDRNLETGRVYYLSGDPIDYDNNAISTTPKPDRTLARICDIPTQMDQLVSISKRAPTLLIDEKYNRTEVGYTLDDQRKLWQIINDGILVKKDGKFIFDEDVDFDETLDLQYLTTHYGKMSNLNSTFQMKHGIHTDTNGYEYTWEITSCGEGYQVGDVIQVYLVGQMLKGVVTDVTPLGVIKTLDVPSSRIDDDLDINVVNLDDQITALNATTVSKILSSSKGNDCQLRFTISNNIWNTRERMVSGTLENLYTFKFDIYHNIWLWTFHDKWITTQDDEGNNTTRHDYGWDQIYQMTGDLVYDNWFDTHNVDLKASMMHEVLSSQLYSIITPGDSGIVLTPSIQYHQNIMTFTENDVMNYDSFEECLREWLSIHAKLDEDVYYTIRKVDDRYYVNEHIFGYNIAYDSTKPIPYPHNHKLLCNPGYHKPTNLLFDPMNSGLVYEGDTSNYRQPTVYMYNPYASSYPIYQEYSAGMTQSVGTRYITFEDFLLTDIHKTPSNVYLEHDVYKYTGYDMVSTEDDIWQYHPNVSDDTDARFPLRLLRQAGEVVSTYDETTDSYLPTGEQPTGIARPISTKVYDSKYRFEDGTEVTSELLYFFKLSNVKYDILDGFHMRDEITQQDISKYSILLYNNILYAFDEEHDTWKAIKR